MILAQEELWTPPAHPGMIVVTTNGTITRKNTLVMGRGAAEQAKRRIKRIEYEAGTIAKAYVPLGTSTGYSQYGFAVVRPPRPDENKFGFGIFQVKWHFHENACLDLIELSTQRLGKFAEDNLVLNIRVNFPGIGAGRLAPEEVLPIIEALPDNVTVCHKGL